MASAPIPLTNVGSGYTIVTQVVPTSTASATSGQNSSQVQSPLQKFLKGEPKALGTVQIMIGVITILFGIVLAVNPISISVSTGVVFWGSLFHISAGSLAVSGSNKLNACVVKATLGVNILSTVATGIAIILFSLDLAFMPLFSSHFAESRTSGITGVLLVFSLLQFAVSIAISAFTCKATCNDKPTLNIINVVSNPESAVPVVGSFPAYQAQAGAVTMSSPPVESPPAYSEKS
ncbi:membrane-spanning 4-domains subfamily A member 8-like [Clarias gariepinus]